MNIKLTLFSLIKAFKYKLLLKNITPEILGYQNTIGSFVKDSRVSNMTHIGNRENLLIGENVFIGHFNYIDCYEKVTIEDGCDLANYISILTHSSHHNVRFRANKSGQEKDILLSSNPVFIGNHTYIGPHSVIMPGTKIGKGCIVSAYSLVSGNFPDFSIIKGQPAKVIGSTRDIDLPFLDNHPEYKEYYFDQF